MDRGSYIVASGGLSQLRKLEMVNNNLANANTPGFKGQFLINSTASFEQTLASKLVTNDPYAVGDHERSPNVQSVRSITDFTQGPIKDTGNPFDLALKDSKDFFVINTPAGLQYTRAGNFTLDTNGTLVTQDGQAVQGDGGAITIPTGKVDISPSGAVLADGQEVGRVQVVRFEDPTNLERKGANRFALAPGMQPPVALDQARIAPKALEMSNISTITSMLQLISANRAFDMYTRSARTMDELDQAAITQIGRPR